METFAQPDTTRELTEEYLTVPELSARIKFSRQTLYNLIHKRTFVLGKHFLKPTPKKILFKWSEIRSWLGESGCLVDKNVSESTEGQKLPVAKSLINI